jgi:hypothetical protein
MGGIWKRSTNIIGATQFTAQKQEPKEFLILYVLPTEQELIPEY